MELFQKIQTPPDLFLVENGVFVNLLGLLF